MMQNIFRIALVQLVRLLLVIVLFGGGTAFAHPHIWIEAQLFIQFDQQGRVTSLRHLWTFDPAFSAWAVQGLDTNGDGEVSSIEMAPMAQQNVTGLAEYDFFTFAGVGDRDFALQLAGAPRMENGPNGVVLDFSLSLPEPIDPSSGFDVAVLDPEYYVAFDFVAANPVVMIGAPDACRTNLVEPQPLDPAVEAELLKLGPDVTALPPDLKAGIRDAAYRVALRCGDEAINALEAVTELADRGDEVASTGGGAPFSAPAIERGLPVARDGVLGWIYERQRDFYQALTETLSQLKQDNNAFWVLGVLSFLYGVFHAAGPGHGKLVISSYVLATERQVTRGVAMSFVAAFVQALVAIGFVAIAGLLINLTSSAMSDATQWLVIGSYGLVSLLGLWLVVRHVFGLGHSHAHHHDEHAHAHHHDDHNHAHHHDEHDHAHHVAPPEGEANFWEMAGVVLSVGMRPCSGALVVLVFALSQGVFLAGIAATFLMSVGTGITVAVLASFAVGFKQLAGRFSGSGVLSRLVWWLELMGALLVLAFGVILLLANI